MQTGNCQLVETTCPVCGSGANRRERLVKGFTLVKCDNCSLVFANPQLSVDALNRLYQRKPDPRGLIDYYASQTTPKVLAGYDEKLAKLKKLTGNVGKILDVGCGAAYLVERAAKSGWDASGVEIGEWARDAASARNVKSIYIGELKQLEFPNNHFDAIYCAQVLEHLKSPLELLGEINRILRSGGIFYVDVPNYRTLPVLLGRDDWYMNHPPQHVNYFTSSTMTKLFERAGFFVEELYTEGGLKLEVLFKSLNQDRRDDESKSQRPEGEKTSEGSSLELARPSIHKRLAMPVVKHLFYDTLKVGVNIVAFARKGRQA